MGTVFSNLVTTSAPETINRLNLVTRSASETTNHLNLVLVVLPLVRKLTRKLEMISNKDDLRRDYLVDFQTSAGVLQHHLEMIEEDSVKEDGVIESYNHQITQLAACLEEVFSIRIINPSQEMSEYPRLKLIASTPNVLDLGIEYLFHPAAWEDWQCWDKLRCRLEELTDDLQRHGNNVDETIEIKLFPILREPDDDVYALIGGVVGAIMPCKCHPGSEQALRVRMGTYKEGKPKPKPKSLCVLLAEDESLRQWHEIVIHGESRRTAELSMGGMEHCNPDRSGYIPCLHSALGAYTTPQLLHIDLHDDALYRSGEFQSYISPVQPEFLKEHISLKDFLSGEKEWLPESKWALAVILAYSLLYLCAEHPPKGWRKQENIFFENILLFKNETDILLQPFIKPSQLKQYKPATDKVFRSYEHPEILEFGVILLQIQLGEKLQFRDIVDSNDLLSRASQSFNDKKYQIESLPYRKVIETCLSPNIFNRTGSDDRKLRSLLYQKIIRPLEKNLAVLYDHLKINDLDREAAKRCIISIPSSYSVSPLTDSNHSVQHRKNGPHITHHNYDTITPLQLASCTEASLATTRDISCESPSPFAMLFDARKATEVEISIKWDEWLKEFKHFRQRILPDAVDPKNQQRVPVTVIDTGIDGSHPFIQSKGWKSYDKNAVNNHLFCDFAEPDLLHDKHAPIDEDGHGTFIAGLLLQLAPDIELSVARIGKTRSTIQNDAQIDEKVARAIEHAVTTWRTHIISLSFGCEDISYKIRDAIEEALKNDVIILAATGNSGNLKDIAYPAREPGVFQIYATDGFGNKTNFSAHSDGRDDQYFIMGSGVLSTWPSSLRAQAESAGTVVGCNNRSNGHNHSENGCGVWTAMSGTSFATPIAAALVATIYQFYEANKAIASKVVLSAESESRFKTPKAMKIILLQMSIKTSADRYNVLQPARGEGNLFKFKPHQNQGPTDAPARNMAGETAIQFFSSRLSQILVDKL
ncbi:peptidase S8/S53 domain-containing protein [Whalleya microplaca]|nr:peptidase S8/S53 domain-containing protein [Whalleya microplaca]